MTRAVFVVVMTLAATAAAADAQGLSIVPSFAITRIYDDNVFYRPSGESDLTTRFSPRIDMTYGTDRLSWSTRYAIDADQFDRHAQLSTAHARQDAGIQAAYHASRRLSFGGTGSFVESQTPLDLNLEAAPAPGRVRARRFTVQPSTTYSIAPRTSTTVRYTVAGDSLADGVSVLTHSATTTVEHHVSPRTDLRVEYSYEHYVFEHLDASTSQAVTAEWSRSLARATSVSLRMGPRVTDGVLSANVAAAVHHQLRVGETSLTYLHTTTTVLGIAGLADTHSLAASFDVEPRPRVRLRGGPAILHTAQGPLSSVVYRWTSGCVWPIAKRLAINASYDVNVQRGNVYSAQSVETIGRNRLLVSLAVAPAPAPLR